MKLINGDCLEEMKNIPDGSVDMILTDPPYGTTACKWDSIIPLEPMWKQLKRIIKPNGAIVMTGSQPFTTTLIASNLKMFKYCWVWEKNIASNFAFAKYGVMKFHEDVCVFYRKPPTYNPIMTKGKPNNSVGKGVRCKDANSTANTRMVTNKTDGWKHPKSVIKFNRETGLHPTQKPVALMEYLIKTYTNEGETVLDFTMGSGTTGVACKNLNRKFIGIELDEEYFEIAQNRISAT
jgi:site-specific DNA-methyltransferase (adenine-specific)